jgi:formiminoglutamase
MFNNWFTESEVFQTEYKDRHCIGFQINRESEDFIEIGQQVALIGIDAEVADAIRRDLFQCSFNFSRLQFFDLGNVRKNTPEFLSQLFNELSENKMNLVILGADSSITKTMSRISKSRENIAIIDKTFASLHEQNTFEELAGNPNIDKIKLVSFQGHLVHAMHIDHPKMNQSLSLGDLRNNMRDAEPALRDVNLIDFHLSSIRYGEIPGIPGTTPSGLSSEEACQLLKYIGLNPLKNKFWIQGYSPKYDFHSQGAKMVSQLVWYYLEGLDQMVDEQPDKKFLTQYIVAMTGFQINLTFWKSEISGRWWVEIPVAGEESYLLPCSFMDYKIACNDEMPKRIMNELSL